MAIPALPLGWLADISILKEVMRMLDTETT